jgi:hypothetical protein
MSSRATAGVINFGGVITRPGNFLRANGSMQSNLNVAANGVGNVFYVAEPMLIDRFAWNVYDASGPNNPTFLELQLWVNNTSTILSFFSVQRVLMLKTPVLLSPNDKLQVQVKSYIGPAPGPCQMSLSAVPQ